MSPTDPARTYRLTPRARADLGDIWRYTAKTWNPDQADAYLTGMTATFDTLADMPGIGRLYHEFTPLVRLHVHRSHLIVYQDTSGGIDIIRVLHMRQDWKGILEA